MIYTGPLFLHPTVHWRPKKKENELAMNWNSRFFSVKKYVAGYHCIGPASYPEVVIEYGSGMERKKKTTGFGWKAMLLLR